MYMWYVTYNYTIIISKRCAGAKPAVSMNDTYRLGNCSLGFPILLGSISSSKTPGEVCERL